MSGPADVAQRFSGCRRSQRGQVALITILLALTIGITMYVYGASSEMSRIARADARTRAVLQQARDALIARAVTDLNRPGSFPCPDIDDDGSAELLVGVDCPSYIGRLPWRTLGVGDIRDEAGETLWYALSPAIRDSTAVQINSNTKGDRVVYGDTTSTVITSQAVAVIFAPGSALSGQLRDSVSATCTMSGLAVSMRHDRCAANYLETDSSATPAWNNAANSALAGAFTTGHPSLTFNDKLLVIKTTDFMPLVEQRVAREMTEVLRSYREASKAASVLASGCDCFPYPDSTNDGTSDTSANRGRIPLVALPHAWGAGWTPSINALTGLPFVNIPTLPAYFAANGWNTVIYYTVAKSSLANTGASCTTCSANATLSLNGVNGYGMFLVTPGPVLPAQTRTAWAHYIDDAQNRDANPQPAAGGAAADPGADDAYVSPPQACGTGLCKALVSNVWRCVPSTSSCPRNVTDPNRDRIFTITAPPPNTQCGPNAGVLLQNAPCHTTGNNVKASCQQAASNLQGCSCASASTTMITPPCRNTLNPPACQAAVNSLQNCTS